MSGHQNLNTEPEEDVRSSTASGSAAEPQKPTSDQQNPETKSSEEEREEEEGGGKEGGEEEGGGEEEEVTSYAALSTLPWPGEGGREGGREGEVIESRPKRKTKNKWRESMVEGDRWREEEVEGGEDGSLADDEDDDEEEEEEDSLHWKPVKAALEVTPTVTVLLHQPGRQELPQDGGHFEKQGANTDEPGTPTDPQAVYCPPQEGQGHASARAGGRCDSCCGDRRGLGLSLGAAALLGPLLVWGGYALLPFDPPAIHSAPLRLVYTLRCSFFAVIPIMLGVVVEGVARLRFGRVSPPS